jgi:hypothetical protein
VCRAVWDADAVRDDLRAVGTISRVTETSLPIRGVDASDFFALEVEIKLRVFVGHQGVRRRCWSSSS